MKIRKMPWADVARFESEKHAWTLKTFLQSQGFEVRTGSNRVAQLLLCFEPPRATAHVQVRSDHFVRAMNVLNANPSTRQILRRAMKCPFCASFDVKYPKLTRKFFLPTLVFHVGIIFRMVGHEAHCENCQLGWQLPGDRVAGTGKAVAIDDK
jgi:hypothetical protein